MNPPISTLTTDCNTLVDILRVRASHQADQRAYTFLLDGEREEVHLTYAELDQQARAIAARLRGMGAIGERALLLYPPGLDFIAAFFGCLYAGVVAVPTYPPRRKRRDDRLVAILSDAQPVVALTSSDVLSDLDRFHAHTPELTALQWLATNKLPVAHHQEWPLCCLIHSFQIQLDQNLNRIQHLPIRQLSHVLLSAHQ